MLQERGGGVIGRAAGDSSHYELAVLDGAGNPVGRSILLPSVTTILEALPKYLQWWGYKLGVEATLAKVGELPPGEAFPTPEKLYKELLDEKKHTPGTVLTDAGGRGSTVHSYAESVMKGSPTYKAPDPSLEGYFKAVDAFKAAFDKQGWVVREVEIPVFSLKHQYAGTLDVIAYNALLDMYAVFDFKTSKAIYESNFLQMEAYDYAAREMGYFRGDSQRKVVRLGAKGKFEVKDSLCGIEDFLAVKKVWHWLQKMKEVK